MFESDPACMGHCYCQWQKILKFPSKPLIPLKLHNVILNIKDFANNLNLGKINKNVVILLQSYLIIQWNFVLLKTGFRKGPGIVLVLKTRLVKSPLDYGKKGFKSFHYCYWLLSQTFGTESHLITLIHPCSASRSIVMEPMWKTNQIIWAVALYWPLRSTINNWLPLGLRITDHNPLGSAVQPTFHSSCTHPIHISPPWL